MSPCPIGIDNPEYRPINVAIVPKKTLKNAQKKSREFNFYTPIPRNATNMPFNNSCKLDTLSVSLVVIQNTPSTSTYVNMYW